MTTSADILDEFVKMSSKGDETQNEIIDDIVKNHDDINLNDLNVLIMFLNNEATKHVQHLQANNH